MNKSLPKKAIALWIILLAGSLSHPARSGEVGKIREERHSSVGITVKGKGNFRRGRIWNSRCQCCNQRKYGGTSTDAEGNYTIEVPAKATFWYFPFLDFFQKKFRLEVCPRSTFHYSPTQNN